MTTSQPQNKPRLYYRELDSLRFLAFLLVLIHHTPCAPISIWKVVHNFGWMGVDLFLCLSAFMFARLLFVEYQEKGDINVMYFYIRRALRIWPLYFSFCGVMLVYSIVHQGWTHDFLYRSIGLFTFTDNILLASKPDYPLLILYVSHLWTISYEEQFYLVIPWFLRVLYRLKKMKVLIVMGAIVGFGFILRALLIQLKVDHTVIWVLPITHFESICGGLLIGLGLFDNHFKNIPSWIFLMLGLSALVVVTLLPNIDLTQWGLMWTYPLVGIGMSLILYASMQGQLWILSKFLNNKLVAYLGKISFGLYVYHLAAHPLAFKMTSHFVEQQHLYLYPIIGLAVKLIVTILIAALSYKFLEKPFLRLKERFTFIHSRPI